MWDAEAAGAHLDLVSGERHLSLELTGDGGSVAEALAGLADLDGI